jgi:hypothetical protein
MPGLEQAFYIVGLVFMGLMLVILLALLAAVLVIRKKIVGLHDAIQDKVDAISSVALKGAAIAKSVEKAFKHKGH